VCAKNVRVCRKHALLLFVTGVIIESSMLDASIVVKVKRVGAGRKIVIRSDDTDSDISTAGD